jgi:hypothetical protein
MPLADELAFVIVMVSPFLPVWPLMLPGCFTTFCDRLYGRKKFRQQLMLHR